MKLILKKTVDNLGEAGEVVTVKPGYGRNYLIPQGLAYAASEANMARLEEEQAREAERSRRDFLEARRRASQLEGISLVFQERAGEDGKLFGSVTSSDVTEQINAGELDFELEKHAVQLEEPLKALGDHTVPVKLHAEVIVDVPVRIDPQS
ncbi:MAG: 50S ribosomal protein L9 [Gemmatimonadota bacterium]|jgi:large subunit ribosomal protein L9